MILRRLTLLACILLQGFCITLGHIGEPCHSFIKMCFPISVHVFCDDTNICRCRPEYPVEIKPHTCKRAKKVGERCTHPLECTFHDANSYCTQVPYSSECQCHEGFAFNYSMGKCLQTEGASKSGNSRRTSQSVLLQSAIGFLLACFGLFCCLIFAWHSFCRKTQTADGWVTRRNLNMVATSSTAAALNNRPLSFASRTGTSGGGNGGVLGRANNYSIHSMAPAYETSFYDQPPPTYEEAIKASTSSPIVASPKTATTTAETTTQS